MLTTTLNRPITKQPWALRLGLLNNATEYYEIIEGGEKWKIASFQKWAKVTLASGKTGKVVFYRVQEQPLYLEIMHYNGAEEYRQKVTLESNLNDSDQLELWFICDCGNKVRQLCLHSYSQAWRCPSHGSK